MAKFGAKPLSAALLGLGLCLAALSARAEQEPPTEHGTPAAEHGEHGAATGEHGAHGAEHGAHGAGEINWYHGMIAERDGVEPDLLWRKKGTPPPLLALVFNTAVLFYLLGRYGAPKVSLALKKRKVNIMQGIDEAQKMKTDAERRLEEYEEKIEGIDAEIKRVTREMREAGEAERVRILAEAKEKRTRLERDAHLLIDQELKAARELLLRETVRSAIGSAQELLAQQTSVNDQHRLADEYIKSVGNTLGAKS